MREWRLASPWGIHRDGDLTDPIAAFHAGHVNDALRLKLPPSNPLLVASETSGVWLVDEMGGLARPLSWTWTAPRLNCLARGYYAEDHVYAGGDALYETDVSQPTPLFHWRVVTLTDPNRNPIGIGTIYRAVVVYRRRTLVLATSTGVWSAKIPPVPGGTYVATKAKG